MRPFEPNDYRKRVLAAVEARGGPSTSDPFELYDIPLDGAERLSDAAVAERLAEVWAFWQRQRDHPKYRVLVAALVTAHDATSASLRDRHARTALAARVRAERESRDRGRFELFDGAVSALVARHGGIPRDKLSRLEEVGRDSGLTAAEVAARLRMHRVVDPAPARADPPAESGRGVSEHRRRQVRALLDELGRIWESPPPATLLALLGCDPDAGDAEIATSAAAWRARARELPSARIRTVVDELLVHVADLLESGPDMRAAYLDGVAADVAERLRPRVRAAVLVEDRLTADDHAHLAAEAATLGLDPGRARRVLAGLATELGAPVDAPAAEPRRRAGRPSAPSPSTPSPSAPSPSAPSPTPARPGRAWEAPLKAARAALRAGRPVEAQRLAEDARRAALPERQPSVSAAADEIETVLADARLRWRAATAALQARRYAEALEHLEHLARTAADVPAGEPASRPNTAEGALAEARAAVAEADRLVAAAAAAPEGARTAGLLAALAACPDHPAALAALAAVPLGPPARVRAERLPGGDVAVSWEPSADAGATAVPVTYKVTRLEADGSWRAVGRTGGTGVTDGGAPAGPRVPVYAVTALHTGRTSPAVRSDAPRPAPAVLDLPAPRDVRADREADGTVVVRWAPPDPAPGSGVEYQVSRRAPEGSWRVVGRTRATALTDGGAPVEGPLPGYGVVARAGGSASRRAVSAPVATEAPEAPEAQPARSPQPAPSPQAAPSPPAADAGPPGGIPTVRDLGVDGEGRLVFAWPAGVTEVMVVLRTGAPPAAPDDPAATAWKVTNTRYDVDGGVRLPARTEHEDRHVAVASCRRVEGRLVVAPGFVPAARLVLPAPF